VMAALRRQADVAIGNVIGSNIFNITAVIGAAALAAPLAVPVEIASRDLWVMIGASLVLTPFVLGCRRIGRPVGAVFLLLYGVYIYYALAG
ncbi:MAG: sodium:calcium antiporter, partial [Proteobacteria bacterium]|nr:sodium:calcium antiporter [Pseudomonadota bacterium]